VPCHDHISNVLRYSTHSQGISQFYLHTPHLSANGMNHTCLCLPSLTGMHLLTAEGWKAEFALEQVLV